MQLETIPYCPTISYPGEEANPHLTAASFQTVVKSDKVSPEAPLLQTEQSQFPQLLPIRLALQILQFHCPSLDTLQSLDVFLVVRGSKLNTVLIIAEYMETIISLLLLVGPFWIQVRMPLALLATWAHF